ncbi:prepilin peptidase (plasmid) [Escherichia coli]
MTLMTLTDAASCRLPRPFTLTFLMLGVAFRLWQGDAAIALACALFWFLLLSLLRRYTSYRKGVETLGLGDVFLIAGVRHVVICQQHSVDHRYCRRQHNDLYVAVPAQ